MQREGHDVTTTPGSSGQFDVLAEGRPVFSKRDEGRFPETDEILSALG